MILTIDTTEGVRLLASPTVQERQAKLTQSTSLLILVRKPWERAGPWALNVVGERHTLPRSCTFLWWQSVHCEFGGQHIRVHESQPGRG